MDIRKKLGKINDDIRLQLFIIGYADSRNGIIRTLEEIKTILTTLCERYGWPQDGNEYRLMMEHYNNGCSSFVERRQDYDLEKPVRKLYENSNLIPDIDAPITLVNPTEEFVYPVFLSKDNLDNDLLNIIKTYPDFDYEMKLYENEMKESEGKHR